MTSARTILGKFGPMVYLPTVLFSLGDGAILPLIPVMASTLGADLALGALVVSMRVIGQLCGNIPAAWMVARFGERTTMVASGMVSMIAMTAVILAPTIATLAAAIFTIGVCAAVFGLARHAFMTTRVPAAFRARALSLLGGSARLGAFVGPLAASALLQVFATVAASVWFFLICLAVLVALVLFGQDPETAINPPLTRMTPAPPAPRAGIVRTMWDHRGILARLGLASAAMSAVRSARLVVLPLWGLSLGLDAATITLVVGIAGATDFALFYLSGHVMDRFGAAWAAIPSMLITGVGFLALTLTHDLATASIWYVALAVILGLGNAPSSVVLLAVGSDAAPQSDPAAFLGSWRTLMDAGAAAAPLLVTGLTAAVSLPLAVGAVGVVSLAGAVGFHRWLPRR